MKNLIIAIILMLGFVSCTKEEFKPIETGVRVVVHGFIDSPEYRPTPEFEGKDLIITSPYSRTTRMKKNETITIGTSYWPAPNSNPSIIRNHKITIYVNGSVYKTLNVGDNDFIYTYTQPF